MVNRLLLLFLGFCFVYCEDLLIKRETTCDFDGKTFTVGQSQTPNKCLDVCLCEEDGNFHCRTCSQPKPTNQCNGWAHELRKVDFHVGTEENGCDCFKYECHKKSLKSLFKELWSKVKSKIYKVVDGNKESKANDIIKQDW